MTAQIKVKIIPKFPSDVLGGPGIGIAKSGRTYTISIDSANLFADFPVVTVPTASDKLVLDGATKREITVENFRLAQGLGVLATDYGAVPDSSTAGVPAANTAAILAAFAASPYVNLGGRTFYVTSIAIPVLAKRLFNGTLVAGGTYGASTAVVSVSANTAGFTLDSVTISVDVSTYTTTNGVALIGGTANATVSNCSLSGIYPVFISRTMNPKVIGNTFASGTFGRAIFATSDGAAAVTFTVTSASPGVFTKVAHGLAVNDTAILYTTGALYTGLTIGRLVYIKTVPTADTFTASLTLGGTAINTSGAQSGTHYYTSNGPIGLYIANNTIYKSASVSSQGIVLIGVDDATVANNLILGGSHFGISSGLGARNSITNNVVSYTIKEGVHTDSGVNAIIANNIATFDNTSTDVGISVSSDNGPPAVNTQVVGNSIDSPYGAGIYFVGAVGGSAQGNKIRNANVADTTLSASIILDGSTTTKCTIGQNTIVDTIANNDYQVGEGNYTSGAPTANYIAPQIGPTGLLGRILSVATTDTAIRASTSPSSVDTANGFWFGASAFAKRDTGGLSVGLFDYDNTLVGSLGGSGTPLTNWGQTTHRWSSRGYGSVYAELGTAGFALSGATSGTSTLKAPAVAGSGVFTLPASATDTLVGKASTDTLTNKTFNTAGTGNAFTVNAVSLDTAWTSYTPTVTAGSGTFTTVSATGAYKQIGKSILVRIRVNITTNNTAAGRVEATLPVAVGGGTDAQPLCGQNNSSAAGLSVAITPAVSTTKVLLFTVTATYPGADATVLIAGGSYEVP